jgi:hypothetical protein
MALVPATAFDITPDGVLGTQSGASERADLIAAGTATTWRTAAAGDRFSVLAIDRATGAHTVVAEDGANPHYYPRDTSSSAGSPVASSRFRLTSGASGQPVLASQAMYTVGPRCRTRAGEPPDVGSAGSVADLVARWRHPVVRPQRRRHPSGTQFVAVRFVDISKHELHVVITAIAARVAEDAR